MARKATKRARRDRGQGNLWLPKGSSIYWAQYYDRNGQRMRTSTKESNLDLARKFLNEAVAAAATGTVSKRLTKVTVAEIVAENLLHKKNKQQASWDDDDRRWRLHLEPYFKDVLAKDVTTATINQYIAARKVEEAPKDAVAELALNATINRELALLRRSFNYALKEQTPAKVNLVPGFPMLKETKGRKGFLTDAQYTALGQSCSDLWLRTAFELSANFAWRRNEVFSLPVRQYDAEKRTLVLEDSKNGEGRLIVLPPTINQLVAAMANGKQPNDLLITRPDGSPAGDFRVLWASVTEKAGVPGLLWHDLRRTGARNLRRMGFDEKVCMKVGGWKTAEVFKRYNIVSTDDLTEVAKQMEARFEVRRQSGDKEAVPEVRQQVQ